LAHDGGGGLVLAEPLKGRVPQLAVARPFRESHLPDELRPDPVSAAYTGGPFVERARLLLELAQPLLEIAEHPVVEAGADLAGVDEAAVVVDAPEQRTDPDARALRLGVAADHDLLLLETLDLEPVGTARAAIRRIAPLGDDALDAELAGVSQEIRARADDVIAEAQDGRFVSRPAQQPLERRLPVLEPRARQVPAVE